MINDIVDAVYIPLFLYLRKENLMIGFVNGEKLLTESDLPPQWNMLSGTKDLSNFYFNSSGVGEIQSKSQVSSSPNAGIIQTDNVAHLYGSPSNRSMIWGRANPYFNKGYYTVSFVARHNDTNDTNQTYSIGLFSTYTNDRGGSPAANFNITGTFQKYSGTFYIDTAGNYTDWRLGNAADAPYPGGSIYITDIKIEPGTVATTWMPAISDLTLKSYQEG